MATISFISTFNLSLSPPQFKFADTSDYAGQSITTSNVNGCFKIISPSGITIYDNTDFSDANCDIKVSTSLLNQTTIYLPLDTLSLVELGTYTIIYSVYDKNLTTTSTQTNSYDNEYVSPVVKITQDVNCISQIFGQTDVTNYVVNGVSPTTLSRTNTLFYPPGVRGGAPLPVVVTSDTLRTTTFFNGTQTSEITTALTYTFTDGLTVIDSVFAAKEITVDCSYYCSIACGVEAFAHKMEREKRNPVEYQKMSDTFKQVCSYIALIRLLIECGGGKHISEFLETIKHLIGDCNCGCNGANDDPYSRVTGWGSLIGADGDDGIDGVDGSTWYSGTVAPSSGTGITGDWYINITAGDVYTKTSTTIWTLKLNIKGAPGGLVLVNDVAVSTAATNLGVNTPSTFKTYTLPINTLKTNGDVLKIKILATITNTSSDPANGNDINVTINSTSMNPSVSDVLTAVNPAIMIPYGAVYTDINATITRVSTTSILVSWNVPLSDANKNFIGYSLWKEQSITVANLTTNTNVINVNVYAPTADSTIQVNQLSIIYIAK